MTGVSFLQLGSISELPLGRTPPKHPPPVWAQPSLPPHPLFSAPTFSQPGGLLLAAPGPAPVVPPHLSLVLATLLPLLSAGRTGHAAHSPPGVCSWGPSPFDSP